MLNACYTNADPPFAAESSAERKLLMLQDLPPSDASQDVVNAVQLV